ncbi:hypothetical protein CGJ05_23755, partial [Vibrio parahaemolyticus]
SHEILNYLDTVGGKSALKNQYSTAFDNSEGYAFDTGFNKDEGLSPMLRLTLMSNYLKINPDIKQEEMEIFLKGSFAQMEAFVQDTAKESMIGLLSKDSQWRVVTMHGKQVIDYFGVGLNSSFFV